MNNRMLNLFLKPRNPASSVNLVAVLALPLAIAASPARATDGQLTPVYHSERVEMSLPRQQRTPKIQIALILDTSNSMDGLIDQARNQMWQVVNEFAGARQNGMMPELEIALFEFGNDNNSMGKGYVRRLNGFTRELDAVSANLFSLTTNGGAEYCGYAIKTAVESLQWSRSQSDIKTIFIAGNESFGQGPVNYRDAIGLAGVAGISVNTIHAGGYQVGVNDGWQAGAVLAGGDYMSIDADQQIVHIVAPQDERIAELNIQLNQTYIPYGAAGEAKLERQMEQDELSSDISAGLLAKRARSKSSSFYNNAGWDLVDAIKEGEISPEEFEQLEAEALPETMREMSAEEKRAYVDTKAGERSKIQQEITELSRARDAYVAEKKRKLAATAPSLSNALTGVVKKQAQQKDFVLEQ